MPENKPASCKTLALTLLFAAPAALAGPVTADVTADTTWAAAAGPWTLDADVVVAQGARLTIEPGAVVELAEGVRLVIDGALVAHGTGDDPITFTGHGGARWGGIVFNDGAEDASFEAVDDYVGGSILEHCVLEGASRAVALHAASPFIHQSTFRGNLLEEPENGEGGAALFIGPDSAPRVMGNTFDDNEAAVSAWGGAIFAAFAAPILQDNTFTSNRNGYGAALCTSNVVSPIVGNVFEDNDSDWEGGGMSLYSSSPAIINNVLRDNSAIYDGGAIHVCHDCRPHATPFLIDNVITGNTSAGFGAGGVGAAWLRAMSFNDIHDNTTDGEPGDFGWFNVWQDEYPPWVTEPHLPYNWWGTTDLDAVAEGVLDGEDEEGVGFVDVAPVAGGSVAAASPRVTVTSTKLRYTSDGEPMPVHLTLYNPGAEREVDLALMVQYGEAAPIYWGGEIDFPGERRGPELRRLTLPENSVFFATITEPAFRAVEGLEHGYWHAALLDPDGSPVGSLCSIRFDFYE